MSVLLEALKNAALEKIRKDEEARLGAAAVGEKNNPASQKARLVSTGKAANETVDPASEESPKEIESSSQQEPPSPEQLEKTQELSESLAKEESELQDHEDDEVPSCDFGEVPEDLSEMLDANSDAEAASLAMNEEEDTESEPEVRSENNDDQLEMLVDIDESILDEAVEDDCESEDDQSAKEVGESAHVENIEKREEHIIAPDKDENESKTLTQAASINDSPTDSKLLETENNETENNETETLRDSSENNTQVLEVEDDDDKGSTSKFIVDQNLRRESFRKLLKKREAQSQRDKIKFIAVYAIFIVIALSFVGVYYLLTMNDHENSLVQLNPSLAAFNPQDAYAVEQDVYTDEGQENASDLNASTASGSVTTEVDSSGEIVSSSQTQIASDSSSATDKNSALEKNKSSHSESSNLSGKSLTKGPGKSKENIEPAATQTRSKAVSQPRAASGNQNAKQNLTTSPNTKSKTISNLSSTYSNNRIDVQRGNSAVSDLEKTIYDAYQAYSIGDYENAKMYYDLALKQAPDNADALLGRAAIAMLTLNYEKALILYQKRLSKAPFDEFAKSGVLAVASLEKFNPEVLSRVESLLKETPGSAHLHFIKGAMLAKQSNWQGAQNAFFSAWSRDSERFEYTFNLAISLDHLKQYSEALRFYKMSLQQAVANSRTANIPSIESRIAQLELLQ